MVCGIKDEWNRIRLVNFCGEIIQADTTFTHIYRENIILLESRLEKGTRNVQ